MTTTRTDNRTDYCLVNFKVIAQIGRDRRLKMTSSGSFSVEEQGFWVPIKRMLKGDCRAKLVKDLTYLLDETAVQIHLLQEHPQSDDAREQLESLYREMGRSIQGLANLKATYESDSLMVGELELLTDKIRKHMKDIARKLPVPIGMNQDHLFEICM